jgi:hypothetical protein
MYKKGGKTNPSKRKAPALSPTGRLLDDPRPQEEEKDIPYFLRKDYVEGGGKSGIASDAASPYEKARDRRSNNLDRLAEAAKITVNEDFYEGKMSKEEHGKAKKAIQKFKGNKDNLMREAGYGRTPEEKKAQDRAIRRMKNKKAKGGMKVKKYQEGGMNATGETRKKRPLEGASYEEKRAAYRADMAKETKRQLSSPTQAMTAYSLVMAGLPQAKSKKQGEANINIAKMTAEKGVEGLLDYFKSDDWGGKVPPRGKVEQFVSKFGK